MGSWFPGQDNQCALHCMVQSPSYWTTREAFRSLFCKRDDCGMCGKRRKSAVGRGERGWWALRSTGVSNCTGPQRSCKEVLCLSVSLISVSVPFSSVQFSHRVVSNSATPWTAPYQASLSITNSWILLKLMSIESVMPSNHLILCHPLLFLPSIFPSIKVFSSESALCIRCPEYWSFSFSISSSKEYSGLISFRIDWFDLLAVQGTLKSLLQHHRSKVFFGAQLSLWSVSRILT